MNIHIMYVLVIMLIRQFVIIYFLPFYSLYESSLLENIMKSVKGMISAWRVSFLLKEISEIL